MIVGVVPAGLGVPEARSLKDRRSVVKSGKDRILHPGQVEHGNAIKGVG